MALVATLLAMPAPASAASGAPNYVLEGPVSDAQARQIILDGLNLQRAVRSLSPVTLASNHTTAQCVSDTGIMSHMPRQCGPYTGTSGEVLAGGALDHMALWMNSKGHRDILLRSDAASVRIGVPNCSFTNGASVGGNQTWQMGTIQTERGANAYNANEPASRAGTYAYPDRYVVCQGGQLVSYVSTTPGTAQIPSISNTTGECGANVPNSTFANLLASGSETQGSLWRLYQAYFLRQPDNGGFNYWMGRGWELHRVASFFAESDEFDQRYGALDSDEFVALVYQNVMCRQPELGGFLFWEWQLENGMDRGRLMILFSESNEYRTKTST